METVISEDENLTIEKYFKYLGATITGNNYWNTEICNCLNKGHILV